MVKRNGDLYVKVKRASWVPPAPQRWAPAQTTLSGDTLAPSREALPPQERLLRNRGMNTSPPFSADTSKISLRCLDSMLYR